MDMTINDRLKLLRNDLSYHEFSQRVGCNLNTARRYELGLTRIPADYIKSVCHAFSVPADWLLLGIEADTEDVLRSGRAAMSRKNGRRFVMVDGERICIVCVPVLNKMPAGPWANMLDDTPVGYGQYGRVWISDIRDENAFALKAWGQSMQPIIQDGDTFLVSPQRRFDLVNGLAAVRVDEGGLPGGETDTCVKYVRRSEGEVTLISINKEHPSVTLQAWQVDIIGEVYVLTDAGSDGFAGAIPDTSWREAIMS